VFSKKIKKTLQNYLTRKIANDRNHNVKPSKSDEQDVETSAWLTADKFIS
jgi:hypothetical protein